MRSRLPSLIAFLTPLALLGCTAPGDGGEPSGAASAVAVSGDFQVTLNRTTDEFSSNKIYIEVSITNLSSNTITAYAPDSDWTLYVRSGAIVRRAYTYSPTMDTGAWETLNPNDSIVGYLGLQSFLDSSNSRNGWHRCDLYYDDKNVNGSAPNYGFTDQSEIGQIELPSIDVYVKWRKITDWRPATP